MAKTAPEIYTRSAAFTGYADLARSLGLDPRRMLEAAGVPGRALHDPDLKIPARAVGRVLEASARRSGVEDFGLRIAEQRRLSNLGIVGLVAREQTSLRGVIAVLTQYLWIQTEALSLVLDESADLAIVRLLTITGGARNSRQSTELNIAVLCRLLGALGGRNWRPQRVCFVHGPPGGRTCHRRVLGAEIAFDEDFNGVMFLRADLDKPIASVDPEMASQVVRLAELNRYEHLRRTSDRVRDLVALLLPAGQATAERVAVFLGFDRRTISRRLASEGVGFSEILDGVRLELSRSYVGGKQPFFDEHRRGAGFFAAECFFSLARATNW